MVACCTPRRLSDVDSEALAAVNDDTLPTARLDCPETAVKLRVTVGGGRLNTETVPVTVSPTYTKLGTASWTGVGATTTTKASLLVLAAYSPVVDETTMAAATLTFPAVVPTMLTDAVGDPANSATVD